MIRYKLDPEIIKKLQEKTGRKKATIQKDIALLGRKYGKLSPNPRAQIYAIQNRTSVRQKLTKEEKESLPNLEIEKPPKITQTNPKNYKKKKIVNFVKYETTKPFVNAHIIETNKAYTAGCYTATFILCRKILENLLSDILRKKYPQKNKKSVDLYYDTAKGRTRDFGEILMNFKKNAKDFGPDKALLQRILQKANPFRDDANKKTHSWYHIVKNKKEIDETEFQDIIDMIKDLEDGLG